MSQGTGSLASGAHARLFLTESSVQTAAGLAHLLPGQECIPRPRHAEGSITQAKHLAVPGTRMRGDDDEERERGSLTLATMKMCTHRCGTHYTLVQQKLAGLIRTLFKVFCLRDVEQKNDMGGCLSAWVGFKLAVLIYTFGNEFQKFPGFQSLHVQRVRSAQTSMLSQECPLMQWFFGAGGTWEGLRIWGRKKEG